LKCHLFAEANYSIITAIFKKKNLILRRRCKEWLFLFLRNLECLVVKNSLKEFGEDELTLILSHHKNKKIQIEKINTVYFFLIQIKLVIFINCSCLENPEFYKY